jgi:Cohesin domain
MRKNLYLIAALSFTAFGSANAQAVLSVEPTSQSVSAGSVFNVDVNVSKVSDLYGYQFDLTFNPNVLSAVSSSEGSFLTTGGNSTFFISGTNDNTNGIVSATADTIVSAVPGVTGAGNIVVFTFEGIKSGISTLAISGVDLLDSAFNSISSTSTGGAVTVKSGTVSAPEIDPASAMSALTLLAGGLAVLGGRRERRVARAQPAR